MLQRQAVWHARRVISRCVSSLSSADVDVRLTSSPKAKPKKETLQFGRTMSDHMLEVDWAAGSGWGRPRIVPYGPMAVEPASAALHYAMQCFEGMKAYVDDAGRVRLFRPDRNMDRLNCSMRRLEMPTFDGQELLRLISRLVLIEKEWIPRGDGYSLYIRPTGISTQAYLGVGPSQSSRIFVITCPVGPYYPEGFKPVSLLAQSEFVRAWPGGTGGNKIGGNYAPTIKAQMQAAARGFTQVLWLFGERHEVTEVGTMNFFVFWKNEMGEDELITAPLDGTILPGVTRQCVIDLAQQWREFKVTERTFTMRELTAAIDSGRVYEAFGCGTAAVVSPVARIHYAGKDYSVPIDERYNAGKLTNRFWNTITGIQYGRIPSDWSVVIG